jgi:XTP/dITP diphosphohydrolase
MSEDGKTGSRASSSSAAIRHLRSDIRPLTSDRVVIATHNPGKLAEMRELLAPYGIAAISAGELALSEPDETGMTFTENACIKALAAAKAAKSPALADDSGLVIEALDGAPGIHSARWAGPDRNFYHAMETIEQELRARDATTPERRRAHFVSALCLAWPDGHSEQFEARVAGTLVWPPRGHRGFGYDPMFLPDGQQQTFGEMSSEEKHGLPPRGKGLSHRARAFLKLAEACLERR